MAVDGGLEGAQCVWAAEGLTGRMETSHSQAVRHYGANRHMQHARETYRRMWSSGLLWPNRVILCLPRKLLFTWLSLPVCQSGSCFNAQGWQLFKSAPNKNIKNYPWRFPRINTIEWDPWSLTQVSHRESLMWKCQRVPVFLVKLLCVLALENYNKHL